MSKKYFILPFILLFQFSCKKNNTNDVQAALFVDTKYKVYDSVIKVIDNMNNGAVIQENHYALNREILISKNNTTNEIVYNADTFVVYQNSPLTYSNKNGSFPLIGFAADSLSIYRHIGGVNYQTWEYLICVKN